MLRSTLAGGGVHLPRCISSLVWIVIVGTLADMEIALKYMGESVNGLTCHRKLNKVREAEGPLSLLGKTELETCCANHIWHTCHHLRKSDIGMFARRY